ncbi:class I SAM-dependent methyltransferase [Hyphococcus sp.]|jgi:SAM-dependent methyltransferase|uniref:class I SAM-dependent methyltransferase n=1 Tax=Hyphococcus sp. TaxID=2038636 RepID=UPI003D0F369E
MADPSKNFGEAADRYSAYRPQYPPEVFDFLIAHVTSGRSRAADLGAGSGQATQTLARLFDQVTAIEPDARLAQAAQLPANAEIAVASAEEAAFSEASLDAAISATAFHWMDQNLICRNAARWLKSGGAFFPFAFDAFEVPGPVGDFYASEFKKWAAYRDRRLVECYNYRKALEESGVFASVVPYRQVLNHRLPSEMAAGLISTFSFARDYARDNGGDDYFVSVKSALTGFGETVTFTVPVIGALGIKG